MKNPPWDTCCTIFKGVNATPQSYINQPAASAACDEAGKRLCTDAEWLRACQGPAGWTYPWGDTQMPGVCNDARDLHPLVEYYGTTDPWIWSHLDQPCLNQLGYHRSHHHNGTPTGTGFEVVVSGTHPASRL